ncbi:hydantoinase/oxoprolinase family protein [Chloroflexota bacterium]
MDKFVVSVDVGGTFTDSVVMDNNGKITSGKSPSTPDDLSKGLFDSIADAARKLDLTVEQLLGKASIVSHGSTQTTNILLTRKGPNMGHITTLGMEDNLSVGRLRLKSAGLSLQEKTEVAKLNKPSPIVPRGLVKGVTERIDYAGNIVIPINESSVEQAIRELVEEGVEVISVCLLWSCRNPQHERRVQEIANSIVPNINVYLSSDICPLVGEYERAATTAINAYVAAIASSYLRSVESKLNAMGFKGAFLLMQAGGGLISLETAVQRPVNMISSGPVGGVTGAIELGRRLNQNKIITADVGGTSFDVALIRDGRAQYSGEPQVARYHVFVPILDIRSIGAGGGSICSTDPVTGKPKVGPESAGAVPGPVCYNRGGIYPTLTDANVILNRINPDYFLGGSIKLDKDKALKAMEEYVAKPLGMDVIEASAGVLKIADSNMASLIRNITIGEGHDPRDFVMHAYGGLSGAHVGSFGKELGIRKAVIPPTASVFSALGICTSDYIHIKEQSVVLLMPWNAEQFRSIFQELEKDIISDLNRDGVDENSIVIERTVDLRYLGQAHEVRTSLPSGEIDSDMITQLPTEFEREYERRFGVDTALHGWPVEGLMCRVIGTGKAIPVSIMQHKVQSTDPAQASKGSRDVYFEESGGFKSTQIYEQSRLKAGNVVLGPAIIEAIDTTIVLHPNQKAIVDQYLNLVVEL